MSGFNWTCPYCDRDQVVINEKYHEIKVPIVVGDIVEGDVSACAFAIGCANDGCKKLTITFSVRHHSNAGYAGYTVHYNQIPLYVRRALPDSHAKPQPDYIPAPLVEDYREACTICSDSPKAAATLARRCIQGMIRDFCKIVRGRLVDEIDELRSAVTDGNSPPGVTIETVDAIDHVRGLGNIGAHMEKDIDLIVPVDKNEARALIELIEMLFEEWYVARHTRKDKLLSISKIGNEKKKIIEDLRSS